MARSLGAASPVGRAFRLNRRLQLAEHALLRTSWVLACRVEAGAHDLCPSDWGRGLMLLGHSQSWLGFGAPGCELSVVVATYDALSAAYL